MSLPRLGFTHNFECCAKHIIAEGITLDFFCSVFWGQQLTRAIEKNLAEGKRDYILVVDYDSWFAGSHIKRLFQLMEDNPDIDALFSVQTRRGGELPLIGMGPEETPIKVFNQPFTEAYTGNFGLTLLRCSMFKTLKKPWLLAVPNEKGEWGDNRIDEDIYFWQQLNEQGFKACVANDVMIGHMELQCTFPGRLEDKWKPIHLSLKEVDENGPPPHCLPRIY